MAARKGDKAGQARKEVFQIRLNTHELKAIERQAKARNLTVSAYIRQAAVGVAETVEMRDGAPL